MFLSAALIGLYAPAGMAQDLPVISVVANHDSIEEGGKASFVLLSSDRPDTPFRVSISISQTGAVAAPGETGRKLVTIDTRGRGNITVATTDDRTNEPTGSIRVTTNPGQGYRVPAPGDYRSASTAVRDNDLPAISVRSGSKISEGGTARFTLSARPRPAAPIDVNVSVAENGKFASEGQLGVRIVTIATNGQGTLEVRTDSDTTDEDDGSITASVGSGQGYSVGTPAFASVDVTDGGVPTPRISISTQSSVIVEGGTATFELTANPRPASSMNVQVEITDSGSFASQGEVGTRTVTIGTNGRASFDVETENDLVTESDGTLTARVLRGTGYLVASSGSVSVTVRDESVQVSVRSDGDIVEGSTATFTLIANPAPPESLAVEVNITESGDFLTGGAYTETVTVGTDGRGTLSVDTLNDEKAEDDGAITATLVGSDSYAVGSPARATARVSDLTPTITIAAGPSIIEGDTAVFTLTASPAPERSLTVSLDVKEEVPGRFTSSSEAGRRSVLVYPDGSGTLEVLTDADETDDGGSGDITATILADDAGGYYRVGSPASASLRVNDDDHEEGRVAVSVANAEIQEGARNGDYGRTQLEFAVTLNRASDNVVTAHFSTRSFEATGEKSAATAGSDYRDSSWVPMWVQFEPGDTETVLNVVVYDDDEYEELPEAFELAISRVYGAEIADGSAIGTILPDPLDAPRGTPVVTITVADGAIVTEGEPATFKLTAKPAPENDLAVDVTVSDDGDYLADADQGARTVTIPGADKQEFRAWGDSVATLVLPTVDDTEAEAGGKIRVRVELAVDGRYDASEAPYEAEVDVRDNDAPPPVGSACVPAQLRSDVERYAGETHHGRAHVDRWMTVLAAFGDNNGYTPMTGAEARQMMARYRVDRWRPVVEAIECLERGNGQSASVRGPAVAVSDASVADLTPVPALPVIGALALALLLLGGGARRRTVN